jgi:hypothetical protein
MPTKAQYEENAKIAIEELFPNLSTFAVAALVFLVVDALLSLDALGLE